MEDLFTFILGAISIITIFYLAISRFYSNTKPLFIPPKHNILGQPKDESTVFKSLKKNLRRNWDNSNKWDKIFWIAVIGYFLTLLVFPIDSFFDKLLGLLLLVLGMVFIFFISWGIAKLIKIFEE